METYVVYPIGQLAFSLLLLVPLTLVVRRMGYRGLWLAAPTVASILLMVGFVALMSAQDAALPAELRGQLTLSIWMGAFSISVVVAAIGVLWVLGLKGVKGVSHAHS
jgi:hypothetical protein